MYQYPQGNAQHLNLDWFLKRWEEFSAEWVNAEANIDHALDAEIARVDAAMANLYAARDAAIAAKDDAVIAKNAAAGSATAAYGSQTSAASSAAAAMTNALKSEGYAVGEQNGNPVSSGSTYYQNNSKYYANQAAGAVTDAQQEAATAHNEAESAAASAQHAQDLVDTLPSDYSDLLNQVGNQIEGNGTELTGAMVSFDDGVESVPFRELTIDVDPVQELNGYDNPWSAGNGENKLNITQAYKNIGYNTAVGTTLSPQTADNQWSDIGNDVFQITNFGSWAQAGFVSDVLPSGKITISISNCTGGLKACLYICDANLEIIRITAIANPISENDEFEVNTTLSGTEARVVLYLAGSGQTATITKPYLFTGDDSSTKPYSPYSNICPITGWTESSVYRTGKNLLAPKFYTGATYNAAVGTQFALTDDTANVTKIGDVYSKSVSAWGGVMILSDPLKAGTYKVSVTYSAPSVRATLYILDSNKVAWRANSTVNGQWTNEFTLASNQRIGVYVASSSSGTVTIESPQIELGTTASDYEAYNGTTYNIEFPAGAGTVYGGTLKNHGTDTWVLTVTMANIASYNGETINEPWLSSMDAYSSGTTPTTGAQVVYTLTNPIIYTLTNEQAITLLKGTNNVLADTGNVTVTYGAYLPVLSDGIQPKLNKINVAPVLSDMVADANLAVNDLRMVNNKLYIVTAAVSSGAALVEGTNVTETTIGALLTGLLNA